LAFALVGRGGMPLGSVLRLRIAVGTLCLLVLAAALPPTSSAAGAYALPQDVAPPLADAPTDRERPWNENCVAWDPRTVPRNCVYANKTGSYTLALVGDSHASHFFPAFEGMAKRNGWRLVVFLKINCPFVDMRVRNFATGAEFTECAAWNRNVAARLNEIRPELVVVANFKIRHWLYADRTAARKAAALARMLGKLSSRSMILADSTVSRVDVPACLEQNKSDIRPCATPKKRAYAGHAVVEREAAQLAGVPMIDLAPHICVELPCPAVVQKRIVFRDNHHLTASFAASLAGPLERLVKSAR
jgi:hypothetical protein